MVNSAIHMVQVKHTVHAPNLTTAVAIIHIKKQHNELTTTLRAIQCIQKCRYLQFSTYKIQYKEDHSDNVTVSKNGGSHIQTSTTLRSNDRYWPVQVESLNWVTHYTCHRSTCWSLPQLHRAASAHLREPLLQLQIQGSPPLLKSQHPNLPAPLIINTIYVSHQPPAKGCITDEIINQIDSSNKPRPGAHTKRKRHNTK